MQLVINTYGSYLRKKDNCFLVKNDDRTFEVSVKKMESITITTSGQACQLPSREERAVN